VAEPLPLGKLAPDLLERCLALCPTEAADVVLGPSLGEDAAVVMTGEPCLVLKSDPITFATDRLGWYAVHVAANDVATRGVDPRWMLFTLLLPPGSTDEQALQVFAQVGDACQGIGLVLVGGHSEVTSAVTRPVVSTSLAAPMPEGRTLATRRLRPGDDILMAGEYPVEGGAVVAREFGQALLAAGVPEEIVSRAAYALDDPGISVLPAARALRGIEGLHALHDPTEGGVACGLWEMAKAAGVSITVDLDMLPEAAAGGAVCRALGLAPLSTLASGALLIGCDPSATARCLECLRVAGIPCGRVGSAYEGPAVVRERGTGRELPWSVTDEITKLFA
jgi:hydrogenase maturation factor